MVVRGLILNKPRQLCLNVPNGAQVPLPPVLRYAASERLWQSGILPLGNTQSPQNNPSARTKWTLHILNADCSLLPLRVAESGDSIYCGADILEIGSSDNPLVY